MIGYAFTGSYCTLERSLSALSLLVGEGLDVLPIVSENVYTRDTRFYLAKDFLAEVERIAGKAPIHTIEDAEPLGARCPLEQLIIAPCTGNTLAKIAHGVTDTAVTMAAKAHLRCDRPTLIALSTNDGMSQNLSNLAALLARKSVYFIPVCQDDPVGKPHSLVADFSKMQKALEAMKEGRQLRPLFI